MKHLVIIRHFLTQRMGWTLLVIAGSFPTYQKGQKPLMAMRHFVPTKKNETFGHFPGAFGPTESNGNA
jgi:hypothetical protein